MLWNIVLWAGHGHCTHDSSASVVTRLYEIRAVSILSWGRGRDSVAQSHPDAMNVVSIGEGRRVVFLQWRGPLLVPHSCNQSVIKLRESPNGRTEKMWHGRRTGWREAGVEGVSWPRNTFAGQ